MYEKDHTYKNMEDILSTCHICCSTIIVQAFFTIFVLSKFDPGGNIATGTEVVQGLNEKIQGYSNLSSIISATITIVILYRISSGEFIKDVRKKLTTNYLMLIPLGFFVNTGFSRLISLFPADVLGSYETVKDNLFSGSMAVQVMGLVVIIPLMEEMIFRGLIYKRIKGYTGNIILSGVVSSLFFAGYHFNLVQGIYTFFLGLILVFVYEKNNNIMAPFFLHAICNFTAWILSYSGLSAFFSRYIPIYLLLMFFELGATAFL